jgi:hypothetical protein
MALRFECQKCRQVVVSKYLRPGDECKCPFCRAMTTVPEHAEETNEISHLDLRTPPLKPMPVPTVAVPVEYSEEQVKRGRTIAVVLVVTGLLISAGSLIHKVIEYNLSITWAIARFTSSAVCLYLLYKGVKWIRYLYIAGISLVLGRILWLMFTTDREFSWPVLYLALPIVLGALFLWVLAFSVDLRAFLHAQKSKW